MSKNAATPAATADKPRSGSVPDILKHQNSFELRYSPIIHKQILETSINREVLQRQMNAFFPFRTATSIDAPATTTVKTSSTTQGNKDNESKTQEKKDGKAVTTMETEPNKSTTTKANVNECVGVGRTKLLVRLESAPLKPDIELEVGNGDGDGGDSVDSGEQHA